MSDDLPRRGKDRANKGYTCSRCLGPGHSARSNTCGMTREQRNERERQRKLDASKAKRDAR